MKVFHRMVTRFNKLDLQVMDFVDITGTMK